MHTLLMMDGHSSTMRLIFAPLLMLLLASGCLETQSGQEGPDEAPGPALQMPQPPPDPPDLGLIKSLVVNHTNVERARHGLPALAYDAQLEAVALWQSRCLSDNDLFQHDSALCGTLEERFVMFNISDAPGENLHYSYAVATIYPDSGEPAGYHTELELASTAVRGWMDSPTHRANILHQDYTHMGVGVLFDEKYRLYITQNFLIEEPCGWASEPCCQLDRSTRYCYAPWDCDVQGMVCG
jgi:uncharacterized protein YkwD